ncbi:MAG: DUF2974 domain-containing protein [Clostridia bacterium]|nr:DUF2974 domain-containing protein [Clostridia bacterium]
MPQADEYITWRGDLSFKADPLNEVDSLIFCLMSYVDLDGIVPPDHNAPVTLREAAKEYFFRHDEHEKLPLGLIIPKEIIDLFAQMAHSDRFADVLLSGYVNVTDIPMQVQFSAVTARLPGGDVFVAVRGTDDTIVGWREDFNLSWMDEVPAQRMTADYLDAVPLAEGERLLVGGHSKGGNLAVWGAVHADEKTRGRITAVYSNDGPGFSDELLASEAYRSMRDRIHIFIPQSSLVGLLLPHDDYMVVRSNSVGIFQHNGLTWEVMGNRFRREPGLSSRGQRNDTVIASRIAGMTREEKQTLTGVFFGILESTGATTLTELNEGSVRNTVAMLKAVNGMDDEAKDMALFILLKLFNIKPMIAVTGKERKGRRLRLILGT